MAGGGKTLLRFRSRELGASSSGRRHWPILVAAWLMWGILAGVGRSETPLESSAKRAVRPIEDQLREEWKLDTFYQKQLDDDGFLILSSGQVSDQGLLEARFIVERMLASRGDVRRAMVKNRVRLVVMSKDEFTTDVPEHSTLKPKDWWDRRARGLGATFERPVVSCGEENVLQLDGDPYVGESILVHEFAHALFDTGIASIDEGAVVRLKECYDAAMKEELWKDTYAATNPAEYWAEGVQSWFHCNRTNVREHNHVNSRAQLREYDPRLAELIAQLLPDNEWVYVPPKDRREAAHLEGLDRKFLGGFSWPERLKDIDIRKPPRDE